MRAGLRRHQITIQKKTTTVDNYGAQSVTWSDDLTNIWAAIMPLRGNEYFANQQVQGAVTHKVVMPYMFLSTSIAIDSNCRVKYGSRYFEILSIINPDERNISLELMCAEAV